MTIYEVLDKLKIKYEEIAHEAVFTVEEANAIEEAIDGVGCKNLFLTNKKGKYYIYVLEDSKQANLKELQTFLNEKRLSFGKEEELNEILNLTKGSVTPLGIINDKDNLVTVLLDKDLIDKRILAHPNVNTKTMSLEYKDLIKIIEYTNHNYIIIE